MPRPFFPHSMQDIVHAVDGPLGLIVGDMPDGTLWVLKRNRKTPGYQLTHWSDAERSRALSVREIDDRRDAINAMAEAIRLGEAL
jgi:hypothetical protein